MASLSLPAFGPKYFLSPAKSFVGESSVFGLGRTWVNMAVPGLFWTTVTSVASLEKTPGRLVHIDLYARLSLWQPTSTTRKAHRNMLLQISSSITQRHYSYNYSSRLHIVWVQNNIILGSDGGRQIPPDRWLSAIKLGPRDTIHTMDGYKHFSM